MKTKKGTELDVGAGSGAGSAAQRAADALAELTKALRAEEWSADPEQLYAASMDNLRYSRLPGLRIYPADEDSVATVLRLANRHRVAVTVRGSGSATTGAATPAVGGWVIDFSRWTEVAVDPVARMAYVQPGATLAAIDAAAAQHGLSYPVDPGSREYATIGGTIATNAGGMRASKYGVTRDYILSLEGFLPTGEFVRWGGNYRKFAAGFNLRDLWIGSEGCLGVITGTVLRLVPAPAARGLCLALFEDDEAAIGAVERLLRSDLQVSACEWLDTATVSCTFAFWQKKSPAMLAELPACLRRRAGDGSGCAALIIEVDGETDAIAAQLERVIGHLQLTAEDFATAMDAAGIQSLWKLRKSCSQAMFELGSRKINEDVVVPLASYRELAQLLRQIHQRYGLPTPTFGHAGDGNFHVHIMFNADDPVQSANAGEAVEALMRGIIAIGGAISGEHGIGIAKSAFLSMQYGEAEIRAMRAIKQALDPMNVLNPDKLFQAVRAHELPRETVRLPWDH